MRSTKNSECRRNNTLGHHGFPAGDSGITWSSCVLDSTVTRRDPLQAAQLGGHLLESSILTFLQEGHHASLWPCLPNMRRSEASPGWGAAEDTCLASPHVSLELATGSLSSTQNEPARLYSQCPAGLALPAALQLPTSVGFPSGLPLCFGYVYLYLIPNPWPYTPKTIRGGKE